MGEIQQGFTLKIADLLLSFQSQSEKIKLDLETGVKHYQFPISQKVPDYQINYNEIDSFDDSGWKLVFKGEPQENDFLNYKWNVYQSHEDIIISVYFVNHDQIEVITANLSSQRKKVDVGVLFRKGRSELMIDPFIHPLGSLVLLYLMHWNDGLLIHASGVLFEQKAFLFTGISGIGKSTMAKLWGKAGATVLNDDRLIIRCFEGEVKLYNNPMPFYLQYPREGVLQKIFLLKQSPHNYVEPLKGALAYSRVLGNFIQQFYQSQMVKKHLEIVENVMSKVQVYELGFKPDQDIVSMIKNMD